MQTATAQQTPAQPPQLNDAQFAKFADLIYKISGMRFAAAKAYYITSKLNNRRIALQMNDFDAYYNFLMTPQAQTLEYALLLNEISINETFFFRNQPQLEAFEKEILKPLLIRLRNENKTKLRIWSCAASTGDEAYTTALQLIDMPEARNFTIEIVGTDISRHAIETAQRGVYTQYAIRNIPQDLMQRYFINIENGTAFQINDDLKKIVQFQECNLMDGNRIRMLGKFDLAFCRNVLIYFDDASKEQVLGNISNALNDDGYLLVGHSENLYGQRHIFKQVNDKGQALAYKKAPPGTQKLNV